MGLLDYFPTTGIYREMVGTNTDGENALGGGGGGEEGSFIDAETGQEIDGAYWACGDCDYRPIREDDTNCPQCGKVVDLPTAAS